MPAATQTLASSRSNSVGFPVFADESNDVPFLRIAGRELDPNLIPKPLDLLAPQILACLQLALGELLQEAAAGFARLLCAPVDACEELVGNGDHHLGHRMSIYGIARRQNGHGEDRGRSRRTRGAQIAISVCRVWRETQTSTCSTSPRGICRKRVPIA